MDNAKLRAVLNAPQFGSFYSASCSFSGTVRGIIPALSGTGAYAGVRGALTATITEAEQRPLLANGKCNTSNSAVAVSADLIVTGSGKVAF